jgi:hypothetical protein
MTDRWFAVLLVLLIVTLTVAAGLIDTYVVTPYLRRHVDRALGPEPTNCHPHDADCACVPNQRKEHAS